MRPTVGSLLRIGLGIFVGIAVYPVLEEAGLFLHLRIAAQLQLRDFLRDPARTLRLGADAVAWLHGRLSLLKAFVIYKSGLLSILLGLLVTCLAASTARGVRCKRPVGNDSIGCGFVHLCGVGTCCRRRSSPEAAPRRGFGIAVFGLLVALAVVAAAAIVAPLQQWVEQVSLAEGRADRRVCLAQWIYTFGLGALETLKVWLENVASRPDDLFEWLCLARGRGIKGVFGLAGSTQKCWIVTKVVGSFEWAKAGGLWASLSGMLKEAWDCVNADVPRAFDALLTYASSCLRHVSMAATDMRWRYGSIDRPLIPILLLVVLCQAVLPLSVSVFRFVARAFPEMANGLQITCSGIPNWLRALPSIVLKVLFLFTAAQLFLTWLSDIFSDTGQVEHLGVFCRLHLDSDTPLFQRFVVLCVADTFNTLLRLLSRSCRLDSRPSLFAWIAIVPPAYVFWSACILSSGSRLDITIPVMLECLSRVVNRVSRTKTTLIEDVLQDLLKFCTQVPLEITYAALVSAFCAHSLMPGGCLPAVALLVFWPVSMMRGCAAFADFSMDEQRKVVPLEATNVAGLMWTENLWFQGLCFFAFSRQEIRDFVESGPPRTGAISNNASNAEPQARAGSDELVLAATLEEPDTVLNQFLKTIFERVEGPQKILTSLMKRYDLAFLSDGLDKMLFSAHGGAKLREVLDWTIDRLLNSFLSFEAGSLRLLYTPLLSEFVPVDATLQSLLRRLAPHIFSLVKEWLLIERKRETLRRFISSWINGLDAGLLEYSLDGAGSSQAKLRPQRRIRSLTDVMPKEQAEVLKDWVHLQSKQAFLIGVRGVVIGDPMLQYEANVSADRVAFTCSSGERLAPGTDIQVRSTLLPAQTDGGQYFPPLYLPALVKSLNHDGSVNVEYLQPMEVLVGYPEESQLCLLMFLQQSGQTRPIHVCVQDFGFDVKFRSPECLDIEIVWEECQSACQSAAGVVEPKLNLRLFFGDLSVMVEELCIRLVVRINLESG